MTSSAVETVTDDMPPRRWPTMARANTTIPLAPCGTVRLPGKTWVPEYGSAEDPDQFAALYAYSPLHNIRPGTRYPATLVMTSDHDDRVVPAHSFKFAATLQSAQAGDAPAESACDRPDRSALGGFGIGRYEDHPSLDFSRVEGQSDVHFAHKSGFMCKTSATDPARLKQLVALAYDQPTQK